MEGRRKRRGRMRECLSQGEDGGKDGKMEW